MTEAPAANTALLFEVGEHVTVRTRSGDTFAGVVCVTAPAYVVLAGSGGHYSVWTGAVLSVRRDHPRQA